MRISDWSSDVCSSDLGRIKPGAGGGIGRRVIDRQTLDAIETIIGGAVEMHDIHALFHQRDERQQPLTIEPARIEIVGRDIRCCDDDDAEIEKLREETPEDRGISNILHLKFIEAEQRRLLRDRSEEHTSELQSLMRISYAVFCLNKK